MGRLPEHTVSRSRWLVAAMLAFHNESAEVDRPMTWALQLSDNTFTVHATGNRVSITAGRPEQPDSVVTTSDESLHRLLTGRLSPGPAVTEGIVVLDGDAAALATLLSLFGFPAVDDRSASN
jgi:putative sterol carrier protein